MQSGLLLLVDADRRVQRGVTRVATEAGLEVVCCDSARAGLNAACALEPAVIVTELELPDFDGHWFVSQIREQPTDVAATPILVVTHEIDTSSRARTLQQGADVFLQKPIAPADLLAQVRALVEVVHRQRDRRAASSASSGATPPPRAATPVTPVAAAAPVMAIPAMVAPPMMSAAPVVPVPVAPPLIPPSGSFDRFPAATVLIALELERRSGRVTLRPQGPGAIALEVDLASGIIVQGRVQGRVLDPLALVRTALALTDGQYEFTPGPDRPAPPLGEFTGRLVSLAAADSAPPPRSRRGGSSRASRTSQAPQAAAPSERPAALADKAAETSQKPAAQGEKARAGDKGAISERGASDKAAAQSDKTLTLDLPHFDLPQKMISTRPPPPKAPTRPPSKASPTRPPKSSPTRPPPVKVPAPRLPAFGPQASKPPLAKPLPAAGSPAIPPRPLPPPVAPARPAALAPPPPARPASAVASAEARRRANERPVPAARSAPPGAREADDEDIIEAENDG